MKKLFFILALYCISCGSLFAQSRFDVNWDGVIDQNDYNLVRDFIQGKITIDEPEAFSAFDANRDGVVNVADMTYIFGYLNGTVEKKDTALTYAYGASLWHSSRPRWTNVGSAFSNQMTIYIDIASMPQSPLLAISENDQMAVYIGDECRCVAKPYKALDGNLRYSAQVIGKQTDPSPAYCQIRYYSHQCHGVFYSEPIQFINGKILGSTSAGYTFNWMQHVFGYK